MKAGSIVATGLLSGSLLVSIGAQVGGQSQNSQVTFTKDVAPILQRSCQRCHRPDSVAPMSLISYQEVRPFARAIKLRTSLRGERGTMPPWFIEKNLGIQNYKNDASLTDAEISAIAAWVDSGAPQGNPADMPRPLDFHDGAEWQIGKPDLIVTMPNVTVKPDAPDLWTRLAPVPTGLPEDRYVAAVETREVNDVNGKPGRQTVGGAFVFHHASVGIVGGDPSSGAEQGSGLSLHEVGRNADWFDPQAGKLLKANSSLVVGSAHLHSNGKLATSHLVVGLKFHPKGYQPTLKIQGLGFGMPPDSIDIRGMEANQRFDAYYSLPQNAKVTAFEPHLHAPGARMCFEAITGDTVQTLSCAKYDANWLLIYYYADNAMPLLPKGTIMHTIAYFDNSPANKNVPDPRNWSGFGQRTVDNMFNNIAQGILLQDSEFQAEVSKRRDLIQQGAASRLGCPTCFVPKTGTQRTNQ